MRHAAVLLAEEAAWRIATEWKAILTTCAAISIDTKFQRVNKRSVAVRITFALDEVQFTEAHGTVRVPYAKDALLRKARIARAACLVWAALARCPGYAGDENPEFWRRVFDSIHVVSSSRGFDCRDPVVGPVLPFDVEEYAFPRFRLCIPRLGEDEVASMVCEAFFSAHGDEVLSDSLHQQLRGTLTTLEPVLNASCDNSTLTVYVSLVLQSTIVEAFGVNVRDLVQRLRLTQDDTATINSPTNAVSLLVAPRFVVWELDAEHAVVSTGTATQLKTLKELFRIPEIEIPQLGVGFRQPRLELAHFIRSVLAVPDGSSSGFKGVRTLGGYAIQEREIAAVFSALPYAQGTTSVEVTLTTSGLSQQLAWIAYAIFHPSVRQSSWRKLTMPWVEMEVLEPVLQAMAKGNNLLSFLADDDDTVAPTTTSCSAYYRAQFEAGTVLSMTRDHEKGWRLRTTADQSTFDVCLESDDRSRLPTWVGVIVPGLGLGWVPGSAVQALDARPPSLPWLSGLRIRRKHELPEVSESFARILSLLGPHLTCLDILSFGRVQSSTLRKFLQATPQLTSLRVDNNGSFWGDEENVLTDTRGDVTCLPLLRELELRVHPQAGFIAPHESAVRGALGNLLSLRIVSIYENVHFSTDCEQVKRVLAELPRLQSIHWISALGYMQPFECHRASSLKCVDIDADDPRALARNPINKKSKLAFLSVLKTLGELNSTYERVDSLILSRIFTFGTGSIPRDIWIVDLPRERERFQRYVDRAEGRPVFGRRVAHGRVPRP